MKPVPQHVPLSITTLLWALLMLAWLAPAQADTQSVTAPTIITPPVTAPSAADNKQGTLHVYVREGCPHCAAAKDYLPHLQRQHPRLNIVVHEVDRDKDARDALIRQSRAAGVWPPGVPSFVLNGYVLVGFDTADVTGAELTALLERNQSTLTSIDTGVFGTLSVNELGLPLFTLAVGLLDGFNPCAMWVLLFLLSLLVHLHDRLRMALIAGTFVLVSGLIYYAFMAAWLNVFLAVGMSTALRVALAAIAIVIGVINLRDFRAQSAHFTLSIPAGAKPGLYARMRGIVTAKSLPLALLSAAVLAIIVNVVELLCTAGFPALYTAILTQQALEPTAHYAYLGLYILGYITDDALMVGTAVVALSSSKLTENTGRWLKLISGAVMFALGLVMLLKPQWVM